MKSKLLRRVIVFGLAVVSVLAISSTALAATYNYATNLPKAGVNATLTLGTKNAGVGPRHHLKKMGGSYTKMDFWLDYKNGSVYSRATNSVTAYTEGAGGKEHSVPYTKTISNGVGLRGRGNCWATVQVRTEGYFKS